MQRVFIGGFIVIVALLVLYFAGEKGMGYSGPSVMPPTDIIIPSKIHTSYENAPWTFE